MTLIDFSTETGSRYLVDVVSQRLKVIEVRHAPKPEAEWVKYSELKGKAVGERWVIVWDKDQTTQTAPIVKFTFVS